MNEGALEKTQANSRSFTRPRRRSEFSNTHGKTVRPEDVAKHKEFEVPREQYMRCARIRKERNPAFAEAVLDEERAANVLQENGVPEAIIKAAVPVETTHEFAPNLAGPATMREPDSKAPEEEFGVDEGSSDEEHNHAAEPMQKAGEPGEVLIGVLNDQTDDNLTGRFVVFQEKLKMATEHAEKLERLERRREKEKQIAPEKAAELGMNIGAERAAQREVFVDLKNLAKQMSSQQGNGRREDDYDARIEAALNAAQAVQNPSGSTEATKLIIKSGEPLDMMKAAAWSMSFVEFFYGDCAPNLDRPNKSMSWRRLFKYLTQREELEYHLPSDTENPDIPGGCYVAHTQSRWNTPEMICIFADRVRNIHILQTTTFMFSRKHGGWDKDMRLIANMKASDLDMCRPPNSNTVRLPDIIHQAKKKGLNSVQKAIQHLMLQTTSIPLTEGYKIRLRHFGHAMNLHDGSLSVFLTTNFADTYSAFTVALMNGAGEPLGRRTVNLLEDAPDMPPLRDIHRMLAKHPMIQVKLFLLFDRLVHQELLCIRNAFCGDASYADPSFPRGVRIEDDYASTGEPGIANFPRNAFKPLEAQGRGFAHGHQKIHSVPRPRAAQLRKLFASKSDAGELDALISGWVQRMREEILKACTSLQYDSAVLSATQLGVDVRPEPFTTRQQRLSRMDGGVELDGSVRELVEVTGAEQPGHLLVEEAASVAEQRPPRHPYKETSLRGAVQSLLPTWRSPQSFGRIVTPDEFGHYDIKPSTVTCDAGLNDVNTVYSLEHNGQVSGFVMPNGDEATPADLQADAEAWATSFARDQRACHTQNHEHECTGTCIKNARQKPSGSTTQQPIRAGQKIKGDSVPLCRFWFFRLLLFHVEDGAKKILRRGKALVSPAFIASTNEKNEYGRAIPYRGQPFRSSTCDVLQSAVRCNADFQYMSRAVPEQVDDTELADHVKDTPLFFGWSRLPIAAKRLLRVLQVAMRSAFVADFYMTKYLAKAQQMLGSALSPLVAGMRRFEEAQTTEEKEAMSLSARARQKIRKLIFLANKAHWFSACELGIYLDTGQTYVTTSGEQTVFTSKCICMMHECQRLLNGDTPCSGLLYAAAGRASTDECTSGLVFTAAQQQHSSEAAEPPTQAHIVESSALEAAEEPAEERSNDELESDTDSSSTDDAEETVPTAAQEKEKGKTPLQAFNKTFSMWDDWLHRGVQLRDMQYYHYSRHVERLEIPYKGSMDNTYRRHDGIFFFEEHYKLSTTYVQILRRNARTVRVAGPQCVRRDVNEGEDNAIYKSCFFSTHRCSGVGECANPLVCRPLLFRNSTGQFKFLTAWKARQAEILTLADRAQCKKDKARRISVIRDTTLCKCMRMARTAAPFTTRSVQIAIEQVVLKVAAGQSVAERVLDRVLRFADVEVPWHEEQLHLGEWQALETIEVLKNLDDAIDGRNTAQVQAAKSHAITVEDQDVETEDRVRVELEDVGGIVPNEDGICENTGDFMGSMVGSSLTAAQAVDILTRKSERYHMANAEGRPKDAHKAMANVAKRFHSELDTFVADFRRASYARMKMTVSLETALRHQIEAAERIREAELRPEQQDIAQSKAEPAVLVQSTQQPTVDSVATDQDDASKQSPKLVAEKLIAAAELNQDQKRAVVLPVLALQRAWENRQPVQSSNQYTCIQ